MQTQPADAAGNIVGHGLHVAAGMPRMLVVTADTCQGPRAYTGLGFAGHEKITEDFERLTDEQWSETLFEQDPPDVRWRTPIVGKSVAVVRPSPATL